MTLWLLAGILTIATIVGLIWPILNPRQVTDSRSEFGLRVFRDQLRELKEEHAQGRIGDAEFAAAETEIHRRMLAADKENTSPTPTAFAESPRNRMIAVTVLICLVPASALAIYGTVGHPTLPDQPFSARADERMAAKQAERQQRQHTDAATGQTSDVSEMVTRLEKRLAEDPTDLDGWVLLGRSFLVMEEHARAAEALRQAVALSQGDPRILSAYGEALMLAAGGQITPDAKAAFQRAVEGMAGEPRARFYLGLEASQRGAYDEALKLWLALEADTPPGAPWENLLRQHIAEAAKASGQDVSTARAAAQPRPTAPRRAGAPALSAEQMANAQNMSAGDRQQMIEGMVGRLAARLEQNPGDVEGWLRLGRSYGVLGKQAESVDAFANAAKAAPEDIDVQMAYARALFPRGTPEDQMPDAFKDVIRKVLTLDPSQPEAMLYGGLIEAADGNTGKARDLWTRLLDSLPANAPVRPMLEDRLKALN